MSSSSSSSSSVDLFGFGHCCADYLALLRPFPEKGKKGDVIESLLVGGGPVPTACQTVAKFGRSALFVGKVGADSDGEVVKRGLREEGVDASFMLTDPKVNTARAYIWIDPDDGSRTVALDVSRFSFPAEDELDERLVISARVFMVDGRAVEATLKGLRIAREAGVITVLDAGAERPRFREMLELVDYAIVSADLADTFAPGVEAEKLADLLVKSGARNAIVTVGERGAFYRGYEGSGFVPGVRSPQVVDTTGAGDVFHGAFIYGLLEGWEIERRLHFAATAAALSTRKLSGRFGIPTREETLQLVTC